MKKHYEKMCMTPLGFAPEGSVLASSIYTDNLSVTVEDWEPAVDSDNREYFDLPFE